jgi:hypothetical protein
MFTWFVVRSNGTWSEPGVILIIEVHSKHSDGVLKKFWLDGNRNLWMPYTNPPKKFKNGHKPMPIGELLLISGEEPKPERLSMLDLKGKKIVIIPARH